VERSRKRIEYVGYHDAVESMHVSYHDIVRTASGICVLSGRRRKYASEPSRCRRDDHVSYLEGIGSLLSDMAIEAERVQISLCFIRKTKHPDSLPDARVELDSAMTREAQEGGRRDAGEPRVCGYLDACAWWWMSSGRRGRRGRWGMASGRKVRPMSCPE